MNDQTPLSTGGAEDVEAELKKIFMSNAVNDGWYAVCCTPLFIGAVVLINLGPRGGSWEWAMSVLIMTLTVVICALLLGLALNCYIFALTDGDAGKVRSWCRWRLLLAVLRLHAHSRPRLDLLLDQIQRQELQDAMV